MDSKDLESIKIIALFGPAGSGKDTVLKNIIDHYGNNVHRIVACTTRPMRDGETEGVNYFYKNEAEFLEKIEDHSMIEATDFRGWFYGTDVNSLSKDKVNIGIFNIAGIDCLVDDGDLNVLPILIDASDKIRLIRQLKRESDPDCDEIIRRFLSDKKDFAEIDFSFITKKNEDWNDVFKIVDTIKHYM